jgi:hypothetical protein
VQSERFQHFNCFLEMIAGAGGIPQLAVAVEMMVEMPLHNYHDLPRAALEPWCAFFEQAAPAEKTRLFTEIWGVLTPPEQTAVIADLRLFLGLQMQMHQDQDQQEEGEGEKEEEDGDDCKKEDREKREEVVPS